MKGRALIDIPHLGVRCGEYVELSEAIGVACVGDGSFDPKAEIPDGVTAQRVMTPEEQKAAEEEAAKKAAEEEAAKKAAEEEAAKKPDEEEGLLMSQVGPAETAEASGGEAAAMTRKPRTKGSA